MGRKWWDEQRRVAYAKYDDCCHACGVHKTKAKYRKLLEAHEAYDINWFTGRVELKEIVALCHSCHNYIHRGLMEVLVSIGKMPQSKMDDIIAHGNRIIAENDVQPYLIPKLWAPWQRWHLVIDNVEYPGRFHDEDEWYNYYQWLNTTGRKDSNELLEAFRNGQA